MDRLMGLEFPKGFNGTVDVEGQPVKVTNGVAKFQGKLFYVDKNGAIVKNDQRVPVGVIQKGKYHPVSPMLAKRIANVH